MSFAGAVRGPAAAAASPVPGPAKTLLGCPAAAAASTAPKP